MQVLLFRDSFTSRCLVFETLCRGNVSLIRMPQATGIICSCLYFNYFLVDQKETDRLHPSADHSVNLCAGLLLLRRAGLLWKAEGQKVASIVPFPGSDLLCPGPCEHHQAPGLSCTTFHPEDYFLISSLCSSKSVVGVGW